MPGRNAANASAPLFRDSSFSSRRPAGQPRPPRTNYYASQDVRLPAKRQASSPPPPPEKPASSLEPAPQSVPASQPVAIRLALPQAEKTGRRRESSRLQRVILGMACLVFLLGVAAALQGFRANQATAKQAAALAKKSSGSSHTGPSTTKPSAAAVASYAVAPSLPRYLDIPSLGVHARVFSLGLLSGGTLATPSNVYDTGWYDESSLPGQPGAMLIDGHVSSWTTRGVFYGLKNLKAGDKLQIQRGDGTVYSYQVVKTQTFSSANVDMKSAITPVTPGKPGLNLITCAGDVIKGTNDFNQRVIVYSQQM